MQWEQRSLERKGSQLERNSEAIRSSSWLYLSRNGSSVRARSSLSMAAFWVLRRVDSGNRCREDEKGKEILCGFVLFDSDAEEVKEGWVVSWDKGRTTCTAPCHTFSYTFVVKMDGLNQI